MKDVAGFFGWVTVFFYALALFNFIMKAFNKKYSLKLKENKKLEEVYKTVMKYVIRYHKLIGIIAAIGLTVHASIMYFTVGLRITGLIAASLMILDALVGVYGYVSKKKRTDPLFNVHRVIAFILPLAIAVHLLFK